MTNIRQPAVAGSFYPADKQQLKSLIHSYLPEVNKEIISPQAIIGPHAGYIYSGPIAGAAYKYLVNTTTSIERVVLIGPSHFVPCRGLALSSTDAFATPLGEVWLDKESCAEILKYPQVSVLDTAHDREHGLEVHLPFLQYILSAFQLIPLTVGDATPAEVAEILTFLWKKPNTLLVISSDLSHFHDYQTAQEIDLVTAQAIESLNPTAIKKNQACGRLPIQGLLNIAQKFNFKVKRVDLRNSGDMGGSPQRVVGYGSWLFTS